MDEIQKKKVIDKIIKEQDMAIFYTYNPFNKSVDLGEEYFEGINYSEIKNFIFDNPKMLKDFSVKNLYTVLATASKF